MSSKSDKDRRKYSRAEHRTQVFFEVGGRKWRGTIINFSEIGMRISTQHVIPTGDLITIPLALKTNAVFPLHGKVVWSKKASQGPKGEESPGLMGIELSAVPVEYLRAVSDMRKHLATSGGRGPDERFEVFHRVRFKSGDTFLTEYTENLNQGGMYIATEEALDPGTIIHAQIEIPGFNDPLELKGKVSYRLDQAAAEERGRAQGVGVQFFDLPSEVKAQLHHYIQRLVIHRSSTKKYLAALVPSKGFLHDFLVPELLFHFSAQEATGILSLERKGIAKKIYFRKGSPIYVESSLRSESIGSYLNRHGLLRLKDTAKWLPFMENRSDFEVVAGLVQENLITLEAILAGLVDYQEERVTNTFPWFDGNFEFSYGTDWPPKIFILPLQTYRMVFSGVVRFYDRTLVEAWMGLSEDCILRRKEIPSQQSVLPPLEYDLLQELWTPKTIEALGKDLQLPMETLLPAAYALIISKWATLDFPLYKAQATKTTLKTTEKCSQSKSKQTQKWKKLIEEDFERLRNLNYFELLGVEVTATEREIESAYEERAKRYAWEDIYFDQVEDKGLFEKVSQILAWIRTARDTLLDPNTRHRYERDRFPTEKLQADEALFEVEKQLLMAISKINEGRIHEALKILDKLQKSSPTISSVLGWYGWVLFKISPKENSKKAQDLIHEATLKDPSESQFYYFKGEICSYLNDWFHAEIFFRQALRLQENFKEAQDALTKVRHEMRPTK